MDDLLHLLWEQQGRYNQHVRAKENPDNYEYWMKQYLLGAVAEVDEVLQEINWKIHRRGHPMNQNNLAHELADLTKFVWCLWEWSGFTHHDMLQFVKEKSDELEAQMVQDFDTVIPDGSPVILTDLDGTLGDWRRAFMDWGIEHDKFPATPDPSKSLAMETDIGIPYLLYAKLKEEFEATGGYKQIQVYPDVLDTLGTVQSRGIPIIAYTARPAEKHTRIWADTWHWINENALPIQELRIGSEARIVRACELIEQGHPVVLLDDDPSLALRAAQAGINVFMRAHPYNEGVSHNRIVRVHRFSASALLLFLNQEPTR